VTSVSVRWGVVGLILSVGLVSCSKEKAAAPPEGFVDVVDTIGRVCADTQNAYECARAVEQYRLGKGVRGVTRTGRRLSIDLANGTVVVFTDVPDPAAEDYAAYAYTEWLGCYGYHLVHRQGKEQDAYLLIHAGTGAPIEIGSVPVLAPDCGRLAVTSGLPAQGSVLQVWRANGQRAASLEWAYEPETPWTPGLTVWKSPTQLSVPFTTEEDPDTSRHFEARLYTDGWRAGA
jgi:hypothetical protein